MPQPKCIIVTGRPGSGKTTLARLLAERCWMPMVSRDQIKEGFVNTFGQPHGQLPPDTNARVTETFFELVNRYLEASVSLVIEAAFQHPIWARHVPAIQTRARAWIIVCDAGPEVAARRHLQRGLDSPAREFYHGDARVSHFRKTGEFLPPGEYVVPSLDVPTIRVDTAEGYVPSVDSIAGAIMNET